MTLSPSDADGLFVDSVGKSFGDRPVVKNVSLRLSPNSLKAHVCFVCDTWIE